MYNSRPQLSKEVHDSICRMIDDDVESVIVSRANWMGTLRTCMDNYLGVPEVKSGPWDGCSDVHIPVTMLAIETAHPRILNGVVGLDEIMTAVPTCKETVELAKDVTGFLNWGMRDQLQVNSLPILDRILHSSETFGKAISGSEWEYRERETCMLYTKPRYQEGSTFLLRLLRQSKNKKLANAVKPRQLEIPYQQHIQELIGSPLMRVGRTQNFSDRSEVEFEFIINGERRWGKAEIPVPRENDLELDLFITADTIIKDAPSLRLIQLPNFYSPVQSNDLQNVKFNIERVWMTLDDLEEQQRQGNFYFDSDMWERIKKDQPTDSSNRRVGGGTARPESQAAGKESRFRSMLSDSLGDKKESDVEQGYEVLRAYYRYKMPGDDRPVEYVFFYMPTYLWIARVVRMEVLHPTKRRPFSSWDFNPDDENPFFSLGLGHVCMDLQSIINDIFNKQMDRDDLINMPFGFFKPTSGLSKDTFKLTPGQFYPVADPQGINIPNWSRPNAADTPYINLLLQFIERQTGATNYMQGGSPSGPNAPRTFGATAAIIQEGQVNFNLHIRRYQQSLFEVCADVKDLYAHFKSGEIEFMAPGANTLSKVSAEVLRKNFGMISKGTAENTNKALRQQLNAIVYQQLVNNPYIMSSVQGLYNVTRRFAHSHEYFEFDIDVPAPSPDATHAPMSQEEEIEMMRFGQMIMPLPIDDHALHMQTIEAFIQSDAALQMPPESMPILAAHMQSHQQLAAMMQRAQMVQGPGGATTPTGGPGGMYGGASEQGNPGAAPPAATQPVGPGPAA